MNNENEPDNEEEDDDDDEDEIPFNPYSRGICCVSFAKTEVIIETLPNSEKHGSDFSLPIKLLDWLHFKDITLI